jgi:hypothetical protein
MWWIEREAAALRDSCNGDLDQALMALEPDITAYDEPDAPPTCIHFPDGTCDVLADLRKPRRVLHECGHGRFTNGLGRRLQRLGVPTAKRQRLREEAIARRFAAVVMEAFEPPEPILEQPARQLLPPGKPTYLRSQLTRELRRLEREFGCRLFMARPGRLECDQDLQATVAAARAMLEAREG